MERSLPIAGARPERRDAAENRRRVLAAAERVFAMRGVAGATMQEVAAEAGVGRATLYRRYPALGDLARALLDERERELQDAFLHGPAPLGPGAPPARRLCAFGEALVDLLERHGDLVLLAEGGAAGQRFRSLTYASYHAHVAHLVREARPEADAEWLAHALLAPLAADFYLQQRREIGRSVEDLKAAFRELATAVAG